MTLESMVAASRHPGLAVGRVDIEDLHMLSCLYSCLPRLPAGFAAITIR